MFTNAYVETNYSEMEKDEVIGRVMFQDVKKFVEGMKTVMMDDTANFPVKWIVRRTML